MQIHSHHTGHRHQHSPEHSSGLWPSLVEALHLPGHAHEHPGRRDAMFTNRAGTRALIWSLGLLGATTVLQFAVYAASGSVALLADTIHNLGDTLNSVPLLIAFWLARRPATRRYTYGFGRAEDLGGLLVVASIVFSAVYILWEVAQKFIHPTPIQNSGWVLLAAILGFLGNEAVALIETRTGQRIGSEAMVVDGRHARIDGLTSLAVIPAVIGSAIGLPILDPIFGVLIGIAILFITVHATVAIWYRLMDAVDPELNEKVRKVLSGSAQVTGISMLRMRWVGHELWVEGHLKLDPALTRVQSEQFIQKLVNDLEQKIPNLGEVILTPHPGPHSREAGEGRIPKKEQNMDPHSHNHSRVLQTEGKVIHWAGWYELFVNRLFGRRSRKMRVAALQYANLKPGSAILDFGCGAGDLAFEIEGIMGGKGHVIGIDPSSEMVAVAKKKAAKRKSQVQFQVEAVEKTSFADNTFDVVTSSFVLHHLPENLQLKAFKELRRVLKPGGLFFAIDMTAQMHGFSHMLHSHMQGDSGDSGAGLNAAAKALQEAGFREVTVADTFSKDVGFVRGVK